MRSKWMPSAVLIIIGAVLILNQQYRWPLYYYGQQLIHTMQAKPNPIFTNFFLFVTILIDPILVFSLSIFIMILTRQKRKGFTMLVFIVMNAYLAAVYKAWDSDPRPFWTSDSIDSLGLYCPLEYGNPSGHSWFAAIFGFGILLNYNSLLSKKANIAISLAAVVLMPLSRMYLGAHSLNQVLEGLLLGVAMSLLFECCLRDLIPIFLSDFGTTLQSKVIMAICHAMCLVPFVMHYSAQLPAQWQINISRKCPSAPPINQFTLNTLMMVFNSTLVNLLIGLGLGYSQLGSTGIGKAYLSGNWEINQQKYQIKKGYCYFVFIQAALLLAPILAGVGLLRVIGAPFGYLAVWVSGLASGFLYAAKCSGVLAKYRVIRVLEP